MSRWVPLRAKRKRDKPRAWKGDIGWWIPRYGEIHIQLLTLAGWKGQTPGTDAPCLTNYPHAKHSTAMGSKGPYRLQQRAP